MNRQRASLSFTIGLAAAAAATTWFTLLSWRTFTSNAIEVTMPLLFIGALVAGIGGAGRWLRLPLMVVLVAQVVVTALCVLGAVTGSIVPTPGTLSEFVRAFQDGVASSRAYMAPIPPNVPPITALLLSGGALTFVVIDLLAAGLRRIPLAGLVLLTVYSVPVTITGNGLSWWAFIAMSVGFLGMLHIVNDEQISGWGRGMGSEDDADPSAFGVRTGAVRTSALAIGTTATTLALALPLIIPTLEVTLFDGNGPGQREIEVVNPMVDLRRDLDRGVDIPLLLVRTPGDSPSYFRTTVLTSFNGDTWTPGDRDSPESQVARGTMPDLAGLAVSTPRNEVPFEVSVTEDFESTWLPTTPLVSTMEVEGDWRYDTATMDFMTTDEETTTSEMDYSFTGVSVQPDPALMDNAVSGAADVRSTYLEVSTEVSGEIRRLAASVTADASTRFRQAQLLQQWFREDGNFTYSTDNIENAEDGNLDDFLDESGRVGYCEQFAASMAIMARILGIPARVAVGFLESRRVGTDTYEFSSHDLHAWPELYFPGAGWVRFEPTPGTRAEGVPGYTSVDLGPEASAAPSPSATRSSAELAPRGETAAPEEGASDEASSVPWASIVLTLLGILLLVALVLVPGAVRRRRRDRRLLGGIEDLWLELRDHAVDLGHGWAHGLSPRASGVWLSTHFGPKPDHDGADHGVERPRQGPEQDPAAVEALHRLVGHLERARYARSASAFDTAQAIEDVRAVESALDHGVGPRVRRRSQWLPRSLRPTPSTTGREVVTRETENAVRG